MSSLLAAPCALSMWIARGMDERGAGSSFCFFVNALRAYASAGVVFVLGGLAGQLTCMHACSCIFSNRQHVVNSIVLDVGLFLLALVQQCSWHNVQGIQEEASLAAAD